MAEKLAKSRLTPHRSYPLGLQPLQPHLDSTDALKRGIINSASSPRHETSNNNPNVAPEQSPHLASSAANNDEDDDNLEAASDACSFHTADLIKSPPHILADSSYKPSKLNFNRATSDIEMDSSNEYPQFGDNFFYSQQHDRHRQRDITFESTSSGRKLSSSQPVHPHYGIHSSPNDNFWAEQTKQALLAKYSQSTSGERQLHQHSTSSSISDHQDQQPLRDSSTSTRPEHISSDNDDDSEPVISWHPYTAPNQESHCCISSQIIVSSDSESESVTSESLVINRKLGSEPGVSALAKDASMIVKHATVCHSDPNEDYKMTAKPRGPCLIINNIDFDSDIFPKRKGSDHDARRFDDIFKQLGFKVILRRNQTADEMKQLCKQVASQCKKDHDALFVIVLSHGSESGIYGSDGIEVDLNDIITYFDNKNCKAMRGKPKVFVIQACRGRMIDYGQRGDSIDAVASQPMSSQASSVWSSPEMRIPFTRRSEFAKGKRGTHTPIRTDMLLIFSCLAGYVSVRNELAGSWLGVALTYFIMTSAFEKDLCRILNMVSADIRERVSQDGHTQCIEVTQLGWSKNLYFNPGIYH